MLKIITVCFNSRFSCSFIKTFVLTGPLCVSMSSLRADTSVYEGKLPEKNVTTFSYQFATSIVIAHCKVI